MEHVFDNICMELEYKADPTAFNTKLVGPTFIGQGCTYSIGSDSYGHYVVEKKQIGKSTIWGLTEAKSSFKTSWTDGSMTCNGPASWKATQWVIARGKTKSGSPKWWFCDENGKRMTGCKCTYGWRGAHSYQDPSF